MEESKILELLKFNIPKKHKGKLRVQFMKDGNLYNKSGSILGVYDSIQEKGKKMIFLQTKESSVEDNLQAEPIRLMIPINDVFPYLAYRENDIIFKKGDIVKVSPLYKEKISGTNCMFIDVDKANSGKDDYGDWRDLCAYVCPVNSEPIFSKNVTTIPLYKLIKAN